MKRRGEYYDLVDPVPISLEEAVAMMACGVEVFCTRENAPGFYLPKNPDLFLTDRDGHWLDSKGEET